MPACNERYGRLLPLWNGATGDCLLDAVAQTMWGISVSSTEALIRLRHALSDSYVLCHHTCCLRYLLKYRMSACAGELRPRYQRSKGRELQASGITLDGGQWNKEWEELVTRSAKPKQSLDSFHVFVLVRAALQFHTIDDLTKCCTGPHHPAPHHRVCRGQFQEPRWREFAALRPPGRVFAPAVRLLYLT